MGNGRIAGGVLTGIARGYILGAVHMTTIHRLFLCLASVILMALSGCGKKEESAPAPVSERRPDPVLAPRESSLVAGEPAWERVTDGAVDEAKRMAESAQEAIEEEVSRAVESAQEAMDAVVTEASDQVEKLMEQVRALISEQNYAGALEGLGKLASFDLTPEQQDQVNRLKAEVEKLMSGKAVETGRKALGDLFEGRR
jgi:hypothetical protein